MNRLTIPALLLLAAAAGAQEYAPPPPSADEPPARFQPNVAFTVETGMNGLGGIATLSGSYYVNPHVALDIGAGFGINKWKYGLRARGFFAHAGPLHVFAGAAVKYATGWGDDHMSMTLTTKENGEEQTFSFQAAIEPSWFVDGLAGGELRFGHFLLGVTGGWSQLVSGRNWKYVEGDVPDAKAKAAMDLLEGSGPMLAARIGFTL